MNKVIAEDAMPRKRRRLPNRRGSTIINFNHAGQHYRASGSYYENGALGEIFLDSGKAGSAVQQHADDAAVLVSLLLQHDVSVETVRHSITGPIAVALGLLGGGQ